MNLTRLVRKRATYIYTMYSLKQKYLPIHMYAHVLFYRPVPCRSDNYLGWLVYYDQDGILPQSVNVIHNRHTNLKGEGRRIERVFNPLVRLSKMFPLLLIKTDKGDLFFF